MENGRLDGELAINWHLVGRAYLELMDDVLPYLPPAEQLTYQRLFRLSHGRGLDFCTCRYSDLAQHCRLSVSSVQRALKGLRTKKLIKSVWQSHRGTTFQVRLLSALPHRPAFLPRRRRVAPPPLPTPRRPAAYDSFSPEDRDLFVVAKRSLSPAVQNELTETAVEWLTEQVDGDPEAFSDEALRDKIDELVFRRVFGPDRQRQYEHLFGHLYTY